MIVVRSPLRITLGGGGTDLPSYYEQREGFTVSACIDRYAYAAAVATMTPEIAVKAEPCERVEDAAALKHPIVREALLMLGMRRASIELAAMSDAPAGTGLGSSGAFTSALIAALQSFKGEPLERHRLADLACDLEIDRLARPVGKQDAYASVFGGLCAFTFRRDQSVLVEPLQVTPARLEDLQSRLLLFFTGLTRSAADMLGSQDARTRSRDPEMMANLDEVKEMGRSSRDALEAGDWGALGELMRRQWALKCRRSKASNEQIDAWYELGLSHGAIAGKLVGAGGGGFLLFLADEPARVRAAMTSAGLQELPIRFDFEGTKVLLS